jgi:excisionase family DNA binding protein
MAIKDRTDDFLPLISLIPVWDACDVLGIKRTKLFSLIKEGELPIVKIGTRTLVLWSGIVDFLERNTRRGGG